MMITALKYQSIRAHHAKAIKNNVVRLERTRSGINASVRVKADTRRLFQALVSPEYVETWLALPEVCGPCIVSSVGEVPQAAWDCYSLDGRELRIRAEFTAAWHRRISVNWKLERNLESFESRVAMRLIGDFDFTTLSLCHAGFPSAEDVDWHERLWTHSLDRLANLYSSGTVQYRFLNVSEVD